MYELKYWQYVGFQAIIIIFKYQILKFPNMLGNIQ